MNKLKLLAVVLLQCVVSESFAQKVSLDQFKNMMPRSIGPAGMSGRVTSIDALYTNTDLVYLGTASGGVWKTENAGASWPRGGEVTVTKWTAAAVLFFTPELP